MFSHLTADLSECVFNHRARTHRFADVEIDLFVQREKTVVFPIQMAKSEFIRQLAGEVTKKETQDVIKPELEKLKGEKDPASLKGAMLDYVVSAVDTVSAKSEEDSQAFRQWLVYLAQKTADASKEGGFLGIGAVRVSEQEQAALDELAEKLGV